MLKHAVYFGKHSRKSYIISGCIGTYLGYRHELTFTVTNTTVIVQAELFLCLDLIISMHGLVQTLFHTFSGLF